MRTRIFLIPVLAVVIAGGARGGEPGAGAEAVRALAGLVGDGENFRALAFGEVVEATTGRRILPVDVTCEEDRRLLRMLGKVLDATLDNLNAPGSASGDLARINEASRLFEDEIARQVNTRPGWACRPAPTASGQTQRSGYPDLEITETATGRITYLDPKLFAGDSGDSSFRTFYYEPKSLTSKITHDARHLVAGISHDGHDGHWKFTGWKLVDIARLPVRLKAEFQASNRELYSQPAVAESAPGGR